MNPITIIFSGLLLAQSMFGGLPVDGIHCDTMEGAVEHIHTNLQLFERGKPVVVPAQIGIVPAAQCLYWLHTHATDGMIHIESPSKRNFTLGEFFDIWQQPLSRTRAASLRAPRGRTLLVVVNGRRWTGDPRRIPLRDGETIVIQSGPPYGHPRKPDWASV